ncbi:hypothetical protein K3217_14245 [bacterium BD-1]|nr:hypothetical protein [Ottowia caeni]
MSGQKPKAVTPKPKARDPRTLPIPAHPDEPLSRAVARSVVRPSVLSALSVAAFRPSGLEEIPLGDLIEELGEQISRTTTGDLNRPVAMLTAQAHTLDAIFSRLAIKASLQIAEHPHATEIYLKLALRAQGQCRATLETLAAIKNPPVVFAKQANIAHGHQQVNNGEPAPRAGQIENSPNKLMEAENGQWLDAGAASPAIEADPQLAPMGAVNRPKKRRGKGSD